MPAPVIDPTVETAPAAAAPPHAWVPWAVALLSFAPLLGCARAFHDLFWFGDEWDQLDQISRMGFGAWTLGCFGENFAPLFKLSWGGLVLLSHGSYFFMLTAVWVVHAGGVVLLGRWLRRAGYGAVATATVLVLFALPATNLEVLGWTIQLITIQGMVFFLAAAHWHQVHEARDDWTIGRIAVLAGLVTLSTFSFVRGALSGGSLAAAALLPLLTAPAARRNWPGRIGLAAVCLVPALLSVGLIMHLAPGNHQHLATMGFRSPALYGASYFLLNPFHNLVVSGGWTMSDLLPFGLFKLVLIACGGWVATPSQRRLLLPLLAFDLGNAVLMGIGRYNEPLITATSSRYQYISLICTLPFLGAVLDRVLARLRPAPLRAGLAAVTLAGALLLAGLAWPREAEGWARFRGRNTREVLFHAANPPAEGAIPGIPFLQTARARELAGEYNLH